MATFKGTIKKEKMRADKTSILRNNIIERTVIVLEYGLH